MGERGALAEASSQSLTVFHWLFILYWILACVAAVRKRREGELGRETARDGGGRRERLQASYCFGHLAY